MFQLGGFVHQTVLLGTPERKRRVLMNRNKPTPWKINMEHSNHPFRKENNLPNPYDYFPC